jgi:hypothetical protein
MLDNYMNKKIELDNLYLFRDILNADDNLGLEKSLIVADAISGKLTLGSKAFVEIIGELITLHDTKSSTNIINRLDDISSQENYSDFITFSADNKDYYIIGDLHADLKSFLQIFAAINFKENFENINIVFLGDYIDRGKDKLELINRIILLKYLLPANIHLLRGNHELYIMDKDNNYVSPMLNADMSYLFNFLTLLSTDEKYKTYGVTKELIKLYADFFDSMPTLALFNFRNIKVCAMHGGLPRANLNCNDYYSSDEYKSFNRL